MAAERARRGRAETPAAGRVPSCWLSTTACWGQLQRSPRGCFLPGEPSCLICRGSFHPGAQVTKRIHTGRSHGKLLQTAINRIPQRMCWGSFWQPWNKEKSLQSRAGYPCAWLGLIASNYCCMEMSRGAARMLWAPRSKAVSWGWGCRPPSPPSSCSPSS